MPRKTNVYILRLVAGKYYVGISKNPQKRIKDHFANKGAGWTRTHTPVSVEAVHNGVDIFEEDMWTKKLMAEHGILNVRGGYYVRNEIPEPEQKMIQREIWSAMAVCMRCGRDGHMAAHCQNIRDVNGSIIMNWEQCSTCGNCAMLPLR
jgi:predicted GIY-YIG superfamily endonuclease